ncbi:hypothetical protein ACFE04_014646 [Oxalis oulophora]
MGEETLTQNQPDDSTTPTVASAIIVTPITTVPATTDVEFPNDAQTLFPPSKMPPRPRKIRKVSPDTTTSGDGGGNLSVESTTHLTVKTTTPKSTKTLKSSRALTVPRIAGRALSCEGEIDAALCHLRNADPLLAALIDIHPPPAFQTFSTPFLALTRSILFQQLAYKAGTSIYSRFIALCGSESRVTPEMVLALTPQHLRQIGVSGRKASYLHDLARKYQNGILSDSTIVNMDDKSLFTMLTMVNGIGTWSVHMFMIFSLHRPDVLPINDLGVRKGVQLLYNLEELPRPTAMEQMCDKWRPYRSVASWYIWKLSSSKGTPSRRVLGDSECYWK